MHLIKSIISVSFVFFSITNSICAQSPTTLAQCEQAFRKNNLLLLAEQYNIDAAKASVVQAKIWDLPIASGEFNFINPQKHEVFSVGGQGQKALQVQQLIYLGHKKQKEVDFAKSNIDLAQIQFEQLLKSLKYAIHQSFYSIYFDQNKLKSIDTQLTNIDSLFQTYAIQATKGNVPLKEEVRLQSLALNLKNDYLDIQKNVLDEQQNLKILTGMQEGILPEVSADLLDKYTNKAKNFTADSLLNTALEHNPDYLFFLKIIDNKALALNWQRSLSKPDITAGVSYDQRGGAFGNQVNATFAVPIRLWDRNRGNIMIAETQLSQTKLQKKYKIQELKGKIENSLNNWMEHRKQYNLINGNNINNFDIVYKGILQNFQKRNISLLEFTDFMESYNQSTIQLNEIKKQLVLAAEELNYNVSEELFL